MAERTCTIDGCDWTGQLRRGMCTKHYQRWRKHGDPHVVLEVHHFGSPADRFAAKVVHDDAGCWLWTAYIDPDGYGRFDQALAHRWSYEHHVGPIPDGCELDHLCRVRHCVNPGHLDPVPHAVNVERGEGGRHNAEKTHCPRGHAYDDKNTRVCRDGLRHCRACNRERHAV